jgi:hypothetical protein
MEKEKLGVGSTFKRKRLKKRKNETTCNFLLLLLFVFQPPPLFLLREVELNKLFYIDFFFENFIFLHG